MVLEKRFISATIDGVSANAWKLTLTYTYYSLYTYSDVFVYDSLQKCKDRLVLERCNNKIEIKDPSNAIIKLEPGKG